MTNRERDWWNTYIDSYGPEVIAANGGRAACWKKIRAFNRKQAIHRFWENVVDYTIGFMKHAIRTVLVMGIIYVLGHLGASLTFLANQLMSSSSALSSSAVPGSATIAHVFTWVANHVYSLLIFVQYIN